MENKSQAIFERLIQNRLIALLTPQSPEQCVAAFEALDPEGVVLEVAFRSEAAMEGLQAILVKYPEALVLAGTVMTPLQAEAAIEAGAAGVVSADYIPAVVEVCCEADVMCVPGGLADAGKQLSQKADLYRLTLDELKRHHPYQWIYKLFPAVSGGRSNAGLAAAWRGPYKDLTVIYTGGVDAGNVHALNKDDPKGIFCGSALTKYVDQPERMQEEAKVWRTIIQEKRLDKPATKPKSVPQRKPARVVTFGEIMLRLSPPDYLRFIQTDRYEATYGGAEANVAVALANYGLDSVFVTALPQHEIGQGAVNALRAFGVDTEYILRQGERVGIYFLEHGASQRSSKVIYDRTGSALSQIQPGSIDWAVIFQGADWFHWSGITPALGENVIEVMHEALQAARKAGVTVSVDLNYRKKLWSPEKAAEVMTGLMEYVDICIGNEEDADKCFGIKAAGTDVDSGQLDENAYEQVARQLLDRFGLQKVAITLRESTSASDNVWSACLYNGKDFMLSRKYPIHIVDRVGGGDSFSSGLIYGLLAGKSNREALEFGVAASCLKQTISGDFNLVSVAEVEHLATGKTGGRVQR